MTDRTPFEARLEDRLIAHAAHADRPVDAAGIAAQAAARAGGKRRTGTWPRLGLAGGRLVGPAFVWLALVALLLALVGASLLSGGRPPLPALVQATATPSPTPTPRASPSQPAVAVLPGEPWIVASWPGGQAPGGGLLLIREDGTDRHEILQQPAVHEPAAHRDHPDWSPDGSQLAFENWYSDVAHPGHERIDIWVSDADGANARQVTHCDAPCLQRSYPAWSPDGTHLAFIRYDLAGDTTWGPSAIEILDLATGDIRIVSQTKDGATAYYTPRWSPDGSQLVFEIETYADATEAKSLSSSLAIVKSDGSDGADPRILTTPDLVVKNPDWHPVDDRIVFQARSSKSGSDRTDLYVVRADGTRLTRLTNIAGSGLSAVEPTWTPDGKRILFSKVDSSGAGPPTFISADGSSLTQAGSGSGSAPRLRPTP
jgi:Tol biopolymer transport system component